MAAENARRVLRVDPESARCTEASPLSLDAQVYGSVSAELGCPDETKMLR
jgi:hypothetical protein